MRAGFSAIEPQEGVFCFIHSEIQNAQPKPRDCELDWQATFVLPAKVNLKWCGNVQAIRLMARHKLYPMATASKVKAGNAAVI